MSLHKKNGGSVGSLVANANQVVGLLGIDNDEIRDVIQSAALQDPRNYMSLRNNIIYGTDYSGEGVANNVLKKYAIPKADAKTDSIKGQLLKHGNNLLGHGGDTSKLEFEDNGDIKDGSKANFNKNPIATNLPPFNTFKSLPTSVRNDMISKAIEETFENRVRKFNQMFPPTFNTRKVDDGGYSLDPNNKALGLMSMK